MVRRRDSVLTFGNTSDRKTRLCAPVAQLDRASDYESEGRAFESLRAHQLNPAVHRGVFLWARANVAGRKTQTAPISAPSRWEHGRSDHEKGLVSDSRPAQVQTGATLSLARMPVPRRLIGHPSMPTSWLDDIVSGFL